MSAPAKVRTWEYDLNTVVTADATEVSNQGYLDRRNLIFGIKESLTDGGTFTTPWVVERSSNGVTADASDNWNAVGDVIWNTSGGARSWIVLYNSDLGIRLLIDLLQDSGKNGQELNMYISRNAFVNGTTTTIPTGTEIMQIVDQANADGKLSTWGTGLENDAKQYVYHVIMSDDGLDTRVLIWYDSAPIGMWWFYQPQGSPEPAWATPVVASISSSNVAGSVMDNADILSSTPGAYWAYHPDRRTSADTLTTSTSQTQFILRCTDQTSEARSVVEDLDATHPVSGNPVCYDFWIGTSDASVRTKLGRVADAWMVNDSAVTYGDTSPAAQEDWFWHGTIAMPWDGSTTPQLS